MPGKAPLRYAAALTVLLLAACSGTDGGDRSPASREAAAHSSGSSAGTSRSSADTSSSGTSTRAGRSGTVTITAIGDVLPHSVVNRDAQSGNGYDYTRQLGSIAPMVRKASIGICQLETAVSADNTRLTQKNTFNSPRELARDLRRIGFDGCSTANNHTWDAGARGLRETRKVLTDNGLQVAGPSSTAATSGRPATYEAGGLKVAQLAYSYTLMNSIEQDTSVTPPGHPWLKDNLYAAKGTRGIIADATKARAAGADLVVVSMHWGSQFDPSITKDQKKIGDALLKSGKVDLIIGAHPHLIQPCAKVNGRYVLYSLGNFISTQGTAVGSPVGAQDGVVTSVRITKRADGSVSQSLTYQPTWVNRGDRHRVELATPAKNAESYRRTVAAMSRGGCDAEPATS